jgi:predicted nucleic acid-binding protein
MRKTNKLHWGLQILKIGKAVFAARPAVFSDEIITFCAKSRIGIKTPSPASRRCIPRASNGPPETWGQVLPSHLCNPAPMSRPLRIEFLGAIYHVTSRGDRREPIFEDDTDRAALLGAEEAADLLTELQGLPLRTMASMELCSTVLQLSQVQRISVYDATYLALALRYGAILLTADQQLAGAAERTGCGG